ncbi:MAG: hypothetical protein ACYS8L_08025 [Planctomycetota bacterium]|jgi:hypothetical protein
MAGSRAFKIRRKALVTQELRVGTAGCAINNIVAGSFSPCFNAISSSNTGTGSGTATGITVNHKLFVTPCSPGACWVILNACPGAGIIKINVFNTGCANSTCTTCPWAYLGIQVT